MAQATRFKLNKDGSGYTLLNCSGSFSREGLMEGSDGALYGTTSDRDDGIATVFKLNKDGNGCMVIQTISHGNPSGPLVEGSDGALYGATASCGPRGCSRTVFRLSKDGSNFSLLQDFSLDPSGGPDPVGLIQASDGKLYGTSPTGGSKGVGAVFKLNKDGSGFALLHDFVTDTAGGDPVWPDTKLQVGSDGALYGTSRSGGSDGGGTVFKVAKDGSGYSVVHNFTVDPNMGYLPTSLLASSNGELYGTCEGGLGSGGNNPGGTVFKLNRDGSGFSIVRHFGVTAEDGRSPRSLIEGSDDILYGTTSSGGRYTNQFGWALGTVFKLTKDGSSYGVSHEFGSVSDDGSSPYAALVEGSDGALYGTTLFGPTSGASTTGVRGTVFKRAPCL
jgi:uncharacterized repeat protein (TIGR03803 family)